MTFVFGFNVDNIVSTRTTVVTLVFIKCHHTTMALHFWTCILFTSKKSYPLRSFLFKTSLFALLSGLQVPP